MSEAETSFIASSISSAMVSETIVDSIDMPTNIPSADSHNTPPSSPTNLQQNRSSHRQESDKYSRSPHMTKTNQRRSKLTVQANQPNDNVGVTRHSFSPDRMSEILSKVDNATQYYSNAEEDDDNNGILGTSHSFSTSRSNYGEKRTRPSTAAESMKIPVHPAQYHAYMQHQQKMLKAQIQREQKEKALHNKAVKNNRDIDNNNNSNSNNNNRNKQNHNDDSSSFNSSPPKRDRYAIPSPENRNDDTDHNIEDNNSLVSEDKSIYTAKSAPMSQTVPKTTTVSNTPFLNLGLLSNTRKWLYDQKLKRQQQALEHAAQEQRKILLRESFLARRKELAKVDTEAQKQKKSMNKTYHSSSNTTGRKEFDFSSIDGSENTGLSSNPTFQSITSSSNKKYTHYQQDLNRSGSGGVIGMNFCGVGDLDEDEDEYYVDANSIGETNSIVNDQDQHSVLTETTAGISTKGSSASYLQCKQSVNSSFLCSGAEVEDLAVEDDFVDASSSADHHHNNSNTPSSMITANTANTPKSLPAHLGNQEEGVQDEFFRIGTPHSTFSGQGVAVQLEIIESIRPRIQHFAAAEDRAARNNNRIDDKHDGEAEAEVEVEVEEEEEEDEEYSNILVKEENNDIPFILSKAQMKKIAQNGLPASTLFSKWTRLYSLQRDGDSFEGAFLPKVRGQNRTLLVVRTTRQEVMAAYSNTPWETHVNGSGPCFYGSAQACLFSIEYESNDVLVYKWSGANRYIQFCDVTGKRIAFGGGGQEGEFGLCIENDFSTGSTGPCETFKNKQLCSENQFDIHDVECWGFMTAFG